MCGSPQVNPRLPSLRNERVDINADPIILEWLAMYDDIRANC